MTLKLSAADLAQLQASDPSVSAFVVASAGSGKTKLLTDRLLRLMMSGADPAKIVCLTFTKAAAAEMALRLRAVLAKWVTMPTDDLKVELLRLSIEPTSRYLNTARSLFGKILDLPGGVNIGTIHSFCQSMLRRFPLEAQVSPHFQIDDEASAHARRVRAKEAVVGGEGYGGYVDVLAGQQNDDQFTKALTALLSAPEGITTALRAYGLHGVVQRQRASLGLGGLSDEAVWDGAVTPSREEELRSALDVIRNYGSAAAARIVEPGLAWLQGSSTERRQSFDAWKLVFLTQAGTPRDGSKLANKALLQTNPNVLEPIMAEQARLLGVQEKLNACGLAEASAALVNLVAPIIEAEDRIKTTTGKLDYPDLIVKTAELLEEPGASWVLYKMDGGIDHLLLDEVQDVSPAQQRIILRLIDDFFVGAGAHDLPRTIFAVGDVKQSIFSFQGADLHSFSSWYKTLREKVIQAGQKWVDGELKTSFRSSAGVLEVVDQVFADPESRRGVVFERQGPIAHHVSRVGQAGGVTLWPLTPRIENPDAPDWSVSSEYHVSLSARRRLAQGVAKWLSRAIGSFELWSRGRTLRAGDVLVLVRNRNEFGDAFVSALKDAGIPVAGLDRITLADSRAVADLVAFTEAVMLPKNDLALATYLASPLGGLSDSSLMDLAVGRSGSLIAALHERAAERKDWTAALELYRKMQSTADFVKPYEFFSELLGAHGGRMTLARRLGPDALEPLDEFLAAAQKFSAAHTPTLRGFIHSIQTSTAEIKRETDVTADAVRIMTVHGAKGLQAPMVIMPDTTGKPTVKEKLFWLGGDEFPVPVICPREKNRTAVIEQQVARIEEEEIAEHNRLLYVALTRAEDHVIVCGTEPDGGVADGSWYSSVKRGLSAMEGVKKMDAFNLGWDGAGLSYAVEQTAAPDRVLRSIEVQAAPSLPAWIGSGPDFLPSPPKVDPDPIDRIVPSRLGDEELANVRSGRPVFGSGRGSARRRGVLIHELFQYLPTCEAEAAWPLASEYLAKAGMADAEIEATLGEVARMLENPAIAPVFSSTARAEVPVVGIVGDAEVSGVIDRLFVGHDEIIFVDFKSDRMPPTHCSDIPPGYVKQVAAYRAVLQKAYPRKAVTGLIAWTASGDVMEVP